MTNIVGQLFKSLDPWPGFQITSFKIQVSPVDGRKGSSSKSPVAKPDGTKMFCSAFLNDARMCCFFLPIQ